MLRTSRPRLLGLVTVATAALVAAAGAAAPIPGFLIQSSTKVNDDSAVSRPGFSTTGWVPASARSTVLAALLASGRFADPFFSTNMRNIAQGEFAVPWWYRADLTLGSETGLRTVLDFSGVLSAADVWVNGTQVATRAQIAGVYPSHELDITGLLRPGTNGVAFKIYPNDPNKNLTMGWIDWVQVPPDRNMGMVRDVMVRRSGAVALRNAHVLTKLTMPAMNHADLSVKTDVRNDSSAAVHATVTGTVAGAPVSQALDLGLNTIRLEGHIEPNEFFDMADQLGLLTLPGWECCDKWQSIGGWSAADFAVAKASMASEAARLRDHPSVISFLIGSDEAPTTQAEKNYVDALRGADWPNPIVSGAADVSAPITGRSGMKMPGPYDWVPPNYWYNKREGGAFGFNSEMSAGPDIPTMDTLKRMMTTSELNTLWQNFTMKQYHRSPSSTFGDLKIYDNALAGRYGKPTSLDDYVRKAQLAQYENVRAQYEAYGRNFTDASNPSTGLIYWMFNSGWTSLHWQLFDYFLDQGGQYYGAKKANTPLHVQYSYDNKSVVVVNQKHASAGNLGVKVDLFNVDGTAKFSRTVTGLTAPGDGGKVTALTVPAVTGLSSTYLARLVLTDAGKELDRNVYWLSTKADVIDYSRNTWYYAPTSSFGDLSGLASMARATVSASTTSTTNADGTTTTTVTLRNTTGGKTPAFFVDAHVLGAGGAPVLPVRWTDNEVSLWPGESVTLSATYRTADLKGATPSVRVSGWNVATSTAR